MKYFICISIYALLSSSVHAQTFRGAISGIVVDSSGAVVSNCNVEAINKLTNISAKTTIQRNGVFSLPELSPGPYEVKVSCSGFTIVTNPRVDVASSVTSSLRFSMQPAVSTYTVTVQESIEPIENTSSARNVVVSSVMVQNQPLNGRDFLRLLRLSPGVVLQGTSFYAVNGNRGRSNNFQIDGADNNDGWQNASAGNQGGVSAIPNTLIPVEAIDQFTLQSIGNAEVGRNSGSIVNLTTKSGTNDLHGSLFYFNRNEALAEDSPLAPAGSAKRKIRNHQYGLSLGGAIVKNRTFYFLSFEGQRMKIGNTLIATTPSDAWIERVRGILGAYNVQENEVSKNLLSLWPSEGRSGSATVNNYFSNADNGFVTDNGIIKLDHVLSEQHQISARYFGATGSQKAFSGSPYKDYFQEATSRLHNSAISLKSVLSPSTINQFIFGYNRFKPTFNDVNRSANPIALGLNTGINDSSLMGAPTINITGFAAVGPTQPQGRIDTTTHFTDTVSMLTGKHQIKIGGEGRFAKLDVFNEINKRGTFSFDGTVGPWASNSNLSSTERSLADFLAGYVSGNNGARITRGQLARNLRQHLWSGFVHDSLQVTRTFNLNFGLRYDSISRLTDTENTLSAFIPEFGIVTPGQFGVEHLYPKDANNFAPRVGIAWQFREDSDWTLRAGYGIYYDLMHAAYFLSNSPSNSGASGINANPGGANPVYTLVRNNFTLVHDEPIFGDTVIPSPPYGVYSVSQDLSTPYTQNYHLTLQYRIGSRIGAQVAYVGSQGRKLALTRNINAPIPGTTGSLQSRRPYNSIYPELGTINELQTIGNSSYNSLQTAMNFNGWKGLTARAAYTWSKSIDNGSDARFILPANSYDLSRERGRSDFDASHVLAIGTSYDLPTIKHLPGGLAEGWQLNSFITAHTGLPLDIRAGSNVSNSFDGADRVDLVGDPFSGIIQPSNSTTVRYFNASAFARSIAGTFGSIGRNTINGPGFATIDFSILKNTRIREVATVQFRAEIFNLLNRSNWANPGTSLASSSTFGVITNTRNGSSAPGIGPGEPRSAQLALKILF